MWFTISILMVMIRTIGIGTVRQDALRHRKDWAPSTMNDYQSKDSEEKTPCVSVTSEQDGRR